MSAPVTFNTALPVYEGGWVLREQFIFMKNADDPSPMNRDMRVSGVMSMLGYGVTRDFALFGVLPYFDKRLEMTTEGMDVTRRRQEFGDFMLMGRYTAYEYNAPGKTFRIAPFIGVKAPTGSDNARDARGRLPAPVQPGSGSWDWQGGVVGSYQTLDFEADSQLSYQANREANAFRAGDTARLDASIQYRLWPRSLGSGMPAFVYGVLEANLVHARKNRVGGVDDSNSGGTTLFLTPGIQYAAARWVLEAGVQIPVSQRLNGTALRNDHIVTTGFRVNF